MVSAKPVTAQFYLAHERLTVAEHRTEASGGAPGGVAAFFGGLRPYNLVSITGSA